MQTIQYNEDNVTKCWCGQCPVQHDSACVNDLSQKANSQLEQHQMPDPKALGGMYCSTGTATCGDLKPKERCMCPECLVWGENALGTNHYCAQGSAQELGH